MNLHVWIVSIILRCSHLYRKKIASYVLIVRGGSFGNHLVRSLWEEVYPIQVLEADRVAMEAVQRAKPAAAKGQYIRRITVAPTIGPGIKLDVFQASQLETV